LAKAALNKNALKVHARLCAIEFKICEVAAMCYQAGGWTDTQVKERHDQWLALARSTFPFEDHLDPAQAALLSGEFEDALSDLSSLIRLHLGTLLQKNR
jgi:hypothetical protein